MSEVRLIDANALKIEILKLADSYINDDFYFTKVMTAIDNAPTINKCDNCDLMFKEKTKKGGIADLKGKPIIEVGSHDGEWILHKDRL